MGCLLQVIYLRNWPWYNSITPWPWYNGIVLHHITHPSGSDWWWWCSAAVTRVPRSWVVPAQGEAPAGVAGSSDSWGPAASGRWAAAAGAARSATSMMAQGSGSSEGVQGCWEVAAGAAWGDHQTARGAETQEGINISGVKTLRTHWHTVRSWYFRLFFSDQQMKYNA